jgi:ABC-type multidrug transport system ATPase subunit/pSer/pThr/pTyr-binding forkhead associated (FHA) protein
MATGGLLSGRTFTIGPKGLIIGRDPTNAQVVIADDEVSRLHAWVGWNDQGEVVIRDRNSANGTFVNNVRIQEKILRPTDEISLGSGRRNVFHVETAQPAAPPPPPAAPVVGVTARVEPTMPKAAAVPGGTSVISAAEIAAAQQQQDQGIASTVAIKLTDMVARPHVELIVDKYAVKSVDIPDAGLKVGREPSCSLQIEHPAISGTHAEFATKGIKVILTDRSTNGTFVNGRRVANTVELHDGDYITFGRYAGKSLIFKSGLEPQLKIERIDLSSKERVTVGRDKANDCVIDHPTVSKHHAEFVKQDGKVFIVDRGSTNGTFVNGIKIKRHQLQELDRIIIGPTELKFSGDGLSHAPETLGMRLDLRNVSFQVADRNTGKPKLLLDDLSLVIKPRELIGFLGPSGAGKTTLMNAMNGFVKPTSGQVLYNGVELYQNLDSLKSSIGFVPQEDIMHRQLTVRQCLYYAGKLRLPEDVSEEEVNRRVEEMLDILKVDAQRWDNPVSTLSGGQRKRISLGIELLPRPGVLYLDEPTAGLDPRTETLMMMLFRQIANQGSTIICTTHLLGSFGVLDKVVVMVQGCLAFYGPGTKFLDYFKAESPPDVYDDLTDNNTISYAQELKKRFQESQLYKDLVVEPMKAAAVEQPAAAASAPTAQPKGKGFGLHQFKVLLARNWTLKFGDRTQTLLLFLQAPIIALLVGLMASGPNQVQTIFMAMFAALWFGTSNAVREIVDEQTIYRRERQTGLKIPSYVFSKLTLLGFVALVQCFSVVIILLGINHALSLSPTEILGAILIMFLVAINGTLIGLVISSLVSSPDKALSLFPLVLIPELLMCGIFLPVTRIQTIIPITVQQLFEGKMFAQPEAKAKANQMLSQQLTPPPEAAAFAGEAGHQVAGAITPSSDVKKAFQKYTPAPMEGMPTFARWISAAAVSRWGLEALSDLCIRGRHSTQDYAYKIVNSISISLHPEVSTKLAEGLEAPASAMLERGAFPLPANFWKDEGPYVGILAGIAVVMVIAVLIFMKRKDV